MQSRTTYLMMADLVDYTRSMEADQDHAIGLIQELRNCRLEPVAARHQGQVMKRMGDGWIFGFPDAKTLIASAIEIQQDLANHSEIRLRISRHTGELLEDESDFYGAGVNLTQRILTQAPPGGLTISEELLRKLPPDQSNEFHDAGAFRLKGIALPVTLFQWRPSEAGVVESGEVPSIAVEAFAFAPDDSETRGAADDLHEQLITRLSRRTGIRVLDDSTGQVRQATYLLRGRLRTAGARGRLCVSLMLGGENRTVWSQIYEGDPSDIFAFCDELIERVDVDLRLQINAFDGNRVAHLPEDRLSLSELRSRAASAFYRGTMQSWEEAERLLKRGKQLAIDDPMALAMMGEATVILNGARYEDLDAEEALLLEKDLDHAVEIAPRSDYVFWVRGLFRLNVRKDLTGAERDYQRVMSLSPAYAPGFELRGQIELASGKLEQATESLAHSVALSEEDPLLPYRLYILSVANFCWQDYD